MGIGSSGKDKICRTSMGRRGKLEFLEFSLYPRQPVTSQNTPTPMAITAQVPSKPR